MSRVLPVKKIAEKGYQVGFEQAFTFQPGSLVNITRRLLAKDPLAGDYVVNVVNTADASVVYGYAISKNRKDDIIACVGRKQPVARYAINSIFRPTGIMTAKNGYFLGALSFLAFAGFILLQSVKPRKILTRSRPSGILNVGAMSFNADSGKLIMNGKIIDLTRTETHVLRIFAMSPNEVIERSRLQKEIWEDEGIIEGRSLDMFISKLRKKLEFDPNIRIVVIRGKGYKLEIPCRCGFLFSNRDCKTLLLYAALF